MNLKKSEILLQTRIQLILKREREIMHGRTRHFFFFNFNFYPSGLNMSINSRESFDCFYHGPWWFIILM